MYLNCELLGSSLKLEMWTPDGFFLLLYKSPVPGNQTAHLNQSLVIWCRPFSLLARYTTPYNAMADHVRDLVLVSGYRCVKRQLNRPAPDMESMFLGTKSRELTTPNDSI